MFILFYHESRFFIKWKFIKQPIWCFGSIKVENLVYMDCILIQNIFLDS